ncbi:hypothetical protein DB30_01706 [Enhygromyxa salina]|uniref:Uncharacterized protein n=1 Tax=Enhygromyxa salina TaxID=215803 RepID=A0A0C2DEZ8_9BACT|nr:hypothetical protein [Enhygromyxa salina]KIG18202.1 hypothetical protein DB30_01706 [Enhygromyxa salina]
MAIVAAVAVAWPGEARAGEPPWSRGPLSIGGPLSASGPFNPTGGSLVPLAAPPAAGPGATIPVRPTQPQQDPQQDPQAEDEDDDLLEQPRGRGTDPATLELTVPELQSKRTIPPFWLERDYNTHKTTALTLPPLYFHRQPKPGHPETLAHVDLSLTIAYYAKSRRKQRWMNPLVLFFGGFSEHKTVWTAMPLLMGYRRVGEQFNFGQFPFVWWWGNRHVKNLFVFPVHFRKKTPDQVFGVSGFLAWYGSRNLDDDTVDNDRRHFVFAPIFFRFQRGLKTIDASPLYFGGKNLANGLTHRTILPFVHWESREFGNRKELWTIPWIRRTDVARGRSAWALPLLLSFRDRNPERELMALTPLLWHHRDRVRDRNTWVTPLGGHLQDPQQAISWAAPVWWRFVDRRAKTSVNVIAPLAVWKRSPTKLSVHTLALSYWRDKAEGGGGGGSLPLLSFVHHSQLRSRQFVLGGLFWRFANNDPAGTGSVDPIARRSAWGVGPLVYRSKRVEQDVDRARFGIPPLLTFTGRDGSKSHQVVTPLFWHYRDRDSANQHDTWVVPPLYVQKRAEGFRAGLPPVFFAANDERYRYAVIPGLLFGHVEDKLTQTQRTISPLFVRTKSPDSRVIGAGLIAWDVQRQIDAGPGSVALKQRDSVLFPLYYRRERGDRTLHVSPLGGALRGPDGTAWLGALAYGFKRESTDEAGIQRSGGGLLPLIHHENRRDASGKLVGATTSVFPLFLRDRRPERDLDIWSPLVWRGRIRGDNPRNNLAIVPLYFGQRQPGGVDLDASFFFVWSRDRTRHTHTLVAGPFYHRLQRDKLITGLGPLSYWEDSSKRRLLVVPPLIVSLEDKVKRTRTSVALPIWFDRVQANRRVWMAFPVMVGVHRKNDFTKAGLAVPLFYDIHRLGKNYRFTGVVPLLFRYQKGGFQADDDPADRYTLWGSFPLFFYGHDGHGRTTHSAGALYLWDKSPDGWKFFTPLAGVAQKPGKQVSWYAPLIYRKVTNEQHTTFLWPLIAYHKGYRKGQDGKPYKDISTTWVLPPLYVGRHNEDRSWWQSTLLVWQFKRPHKVSTAVVPPVFFLQDSYKQRRLHWLLPLYVRDNNMAKGEAWTAVMPGLYLQHRNEKHNNAVQFPLLWHFDNPKRRVTIGGFVWYDVRLPERGTKTQILPFIYARRETDDRVGHMVGPGLGTWRREAEGQPPALHWRALFWIVGGGNEDGQRYLWLFGAKIKLAPKPLAPRKQRQRGRRGGSPDKSTNDEAARNDAIEAAYLGAAI